MATTLQRNKNRTRPSKSASDRRRREQGQIRRLVKVGMNEADLKKLSAPDLRALLRKAKV